MTGSRRQLLFFVIALLLPSAMLLGFGIVLLQQDAELEQRRKEDRRAVVARAWTDSLFAALEAQYAVDHPRCERRHACTSLLWLGSFEDGEARWADDIPRESPLADRRFQDFLIETARIEIGRGQPLAAAQRYRARAAQAEDSTRRSFLQLREARALRRGGRRSQAHESAARALAAPVTIVDEFGTPLALYAAALLRADSVGAPYDALVGERLRISGDGWLTSQALSMLGGLTPLDDSIVREHALLRHVRARPVLRDPSPGAPRWVADATGEWLIRLVDGGRVEAENIVAAPIPGLPAFLPREAPLTAFRAGTDDALGLPFRGLAADVALPVQASTPRRVLIAGGALTFLTLALLAGIFLWRDVRRESRLAALRSQFVSSVSHELRTPLTSIRLYAESMRAFGNEDPEERDRDLSVIASESDRLTRMLDNVLNTSRIERGTMRYRFELGDVSEPVERAARTMTYVFDQDGVALSVSADSVWTLLDADAIEQAVINLLSNALKYGDRKPVDLTCRMDHGRARIDVRDRGPGIGPDARERIFERFYREASAVSGNIPGAGLGLSLVRHIVDAHGGTIDIDSGPATGTTFSLLLPVRES